LKDSFSTSKSSTKDRWFPNIYLSIPKTQKLNFQSLKIRWTIICSVKILKKKEEEIPLCSLSINIFISEENAEPNRITICLIFNELQKRYHHDCFDLCKNKINLKNTHIVLKFELFFTIHLVCKIIFSNYFLMIIKCIVKN